MANVLALGAGGGICCCCCILIIVLLATGINRVDQTEWVLKYSWWSESVEETAITTPGVKFTGPGKYFIKFPNTNKYVYFRNFPSTMRRDEGNSHMPPAQVRTRDGLNVNIEFEYTYKLVAGNLADLYKLVGEARWYGPMLHLTMGVVDNHATTFTAQQFYGNRTLVANKFESELRKALKDNLYIDLQSFMLQPAHFPRAYSDSISQTQQQKQDIEVAVQEQATKRIQKATQLNAASELARRQTVEAAGFAQKVQLDNEAAVSQYTYRQQKEAEGYATSMNFFATSGSNDAVGDFLNYLTVRALQLHNQSSQAVHLQAVR